jgi:hypothetical protein
VFALTIRLRESDGNGISASARDLLELVCSCDLIGEAEGEVGGRPECAHANEAFSLLATGGALSQCGAIIFRLLRTYTQNQREPEDWAVCSDEPQSVHVCTKGARRGRPSVMVVSAVVSGFHATPVVSSVPDVGRASAMCASFREHPKSRGMCRHEAAALTRLEAEKSAAADAENPRELSRAASAAGWLHAPGLENGFAGGGVDGSGDGGGGCGGNGGCGGSSGRGQLPPGGAAHDAHGEDGSDASSAGGR